MAGSASKGRRALRGAATTRRSAPTIAVPPTPAPAGTGSPPPPVVLPKWVQLVLLPLALLGLWALARAAGTVLLILVAASTLALILNPLIKRLQRARVPRGLAILFVYLAMLAALIGVGILLANPISTQVNRFAKNVPSLVRHANHDLANLQHFLNKHGIKVQIQQQGQTALQTLQKNVLKSTGNIVSFTRDLLGKILTVSFDLVLIVVLSVYLLVYAKDIGNLARRIMPPGDGTPKDDFPLLVQRAVAGYLRGQLLFSLIMGVSAGVALWIFGAIGIFPDGQRYAVFFGVFYGLAGADPLYRSDHRRGAPGAGGAVQRPDHRAVGDPPVRRAAAARGPLRRAAGVPDLAADQPDRGDPVAADRIPDLRDRRGAAGAARRGRDPRDGAVPAPASGARAVGHDDGRGPRRGPRSTRAERGAAEPGARGAAPSRGARGRRRGAGRAARRAST